MSSDLPPGATVHAQLMEQAQTAALMPAMFFAAWCDAMLGGWWLPRPTATQHHADDAHELHVPEPIEDTGERALFA